MTRVRLLTTAVIGMGVLILVGLVVLVVGIVNKASQTGDEAKPDAAAARKAIAATSDIVLKPRTDIEALNLPNGAKVLTMTAIRFNIAVLVQMPTGEQVIYLVPIYKKQKPFRITVTKPTAK